jgi:hypothetical protein
VSQENAIQSSGGQARFPPEDCGGDWGYAHLLKVLKNSRHPEYRERKEWVRRGFDPEAFDLKEMNQALKEFEATTDSASTGRGRLLYLQSQLVGEQLGRAAIAM